MSETKQEFSEINGYKVKDANARAEIEALKERVKLYSHQISFKSVYDEAHILINFVSPRSTKYTFEEIKNGSDLQNRLVGICGFYCNSPTSFPSEGIIIAEINVAPNGMNINTVDSSGSALFIVADSIIDDKYKIIEL